LADEHFAKSVILQGKMNFNIVFVQIEGELVYPRFLKTKTATHAAVFDKKIDY
jgi:hypothetical protein